VTAPPLTELAGWDVPLLRGAVGTLGLVADRLAPWRHRLDEVGRHLAAAECWSGPAGTAAADALRQVSTVSTGVHAALSDSHACLDALVASAAEAQELAAAALAMAAAGGLTLDVTGQLVVERAALHPSLAAADHRAARVATPDAVEALAGQVGALAAEALAAGARAVAAASGAGGPLTRLGPAGSAVPRSFDDLLPRLSPVGPVPPPHVPATGSPREVAAWWSALTVDQQLVLLDTDPAAAGTLEGLPAWARDRANRHLLAAELRGLPDGGEEHAMAVAVAARIAEQEAAGQAVQLLQFDPAADLVALSLGDLDTATAVAVLVPGIRTTAVDDLPALTGDARDVAAAARAAAERAPAVGPDTGTSAPAAADDLALATVVWLGYRTPGLLGAPFRGAADRGGPALDRALDGLAAARTGPHPAPRTTVLAHSYGTVVTGVAARQPGRLAADAVVLLGSPGVQAWSARALESPEVYGAWSRADLVSLSAAFGSGPTEPWFGDVELPTEYTQGHGEYYDRDRPTLAAIGAVVAGTEILAPGDAENPAEGRPAEREAPG
jgi:hypothetical protein